MLDKGPGAYPISSLELFQNTTSLAQPAPIHTTNPSRSLCHVFLAHATHTCHFPQFQYLQLQSPICPFTIWWCCRVNSFRANVSILDPLKTPESLWFSCVFRVYKMETLTSKGKGLIVRQLFQIFKI